MRRLLSRMATLLLMSGIGAGCGDGGPGPDDSPVLTTLEVSPATTALYTAAPGNTVELTVVAKDEDGRTMAGVGSPTFSSDNGAVADVSDDGTITATGAGTAQVTASLTAGGVTETAIATVSVQVASATAAVSTPALAFQPQAVDVGSAGSVTWTFGTIHHDVRFNTAGAPDDVPEMTNASAARTFPNPGTFTYYCSIHPSMTGSVRVH